MAEYKCLHYANYLGDYLKNLMAHVLCPGAPVASKLVVNLTSKMGLNPDVFDETSAEFDNAAGIVRDHMYSPPVLRSNNCARVIAEGDLVTFNYAESDAINNPDDFESLEMCENCRTRFYNNARPSRSPVKQENLKREMPDDDSMPVLEEKITLSRGLTILASGTDGPEYMRRFDDMMRYELSQKQNMKPLFSQEQKQNLVSQRFENTRRNRKGDDYYPFGGEVTSYRNSRRLAEQLITPAGVEDPQLHDAMERIQVHVIPRNNANKPHDPDDPHDPPNPPNPSLPS